MYRVNLFVNVHWKIWESSNNGGGGGLWFRSIYCFLFVVFVVGYFFTYGLFIFIGFVVSGEIFLLSLVRRRI